MLDIGEHIEVLLPPPRLDALAVCAIFRRVENIPVATPLRSDVQANAYGCLNLICEGSVQLPGRGSLPSLFLTGPFSAPLETEVTGSLRSASVVIQPWVLPHLTGLPAVDLVDRILPLHPEEHEGLEHVVAAARQMNDDPAATNALWKGLATFLSSKGSIVEPQLALSVLRSDGVQAAAAECSVSERQYRRRFVHAMGLGPSTWVRVTRMQHVMESMSAGKTGSVSALAVDSGYADQAHLSREARALVWQSPKALQRILQGEGKLAWSLHAARPICSRRNRSG